MLLNPKILRVLKDAKHPITKELPATISKLRAQLQPPKPTDDPGRKTPTPPAADAR